MSELCGVTLKHREGDCTNKAKHPDGKCGIHSEHTDFQSHGPDIQDEDIERFLTRERRRIASATYGTRISGLRAFEEWRELEGPSDVRDIGEIEIENFCIWATSSEGRGAAESTVDKYAQQVSKFYQYLKKRGDVIDNPVPDADLGLNPESEMSKQLKEDDGYVAMSAEEYDRFKEHLPAPTVRNQLIFQVLWDCGLRPIEATEIEYTEDIDREHREIRVRSSKTGSNRVVFYGETVDTLLKIWLDRGERKRCITANSSPYLFISPQSEQLNRNSINEIFREAATEADILEEPVYTDGNGNPRHRLSPYSLRHGFAERMIEQEVDLETLRDVMGHTNIETTKQYVNPDKETRRNKVQTALDD
ncbi:tyrosine-type recombinase/integrase [Saliphagus infecundisoli]|uniref:Tyrosine-type recombinase/integrase n=1 Tax=Saliphagus infecundisoli TaxID=1849069 RepID=A0ABD5QK80_9EURY|nr:tyrosine-type recombinase/integrase [Saliphagus infecundisoli]